MHECSSPSKLVTHDHATCTAFVHAGKCEGRKLVIDSLRKDSYCWLASSKGPGVCKNLYTNKAAPPVPCMWDAKQEACIRAEMFTCLTCPKCGTITPKGAAEINTIAETGTTRNCCASDGAWNGRCGNKGEKEYTWTEGAKACRDAIPECPKCGIDGNNKLSCCATNGAWRGKCGDVGQGKSHTWIEGLKACLSKSSLDFCVM